MSTSPARPKPGYVIERQPKPTALRILLVLAGLAVPALVIWDLSTATSAEIKGGEGWPLMFLIGSLFVAYWLIEKANEPDLVERHVPDVPITRPTKTTPTDES